MNEQILLGLSVFVAAIWLMTAVNSSSTAISANAAVSNTTENVIKVKVGGGNATVLLTQYLPSKITIKVGDSVTWYNPASVASPHTVTFVMDNSTDTDFLQGFLVPASTKFMPAPPGSNGQPEMFNGTTGTKMIIAANIRGTSPFVIDASGNVKAINGNGTSSSYLMNGNEKYVNSGWILPKGQSIATHMLNAFTLTFTKPGIYNYHDLLYSWMKGTVIVK